MFSFFKNKEKSIISTGYAEQHPDTPFEASVVPVIKHQVKIDEKILQKFI
jgi:hypothetical protein